MKFVLQVIGRLLLVRLSFLTRACLQVESVTNQMHEMKQEYEAKLARYARLLDARAARIKVECSGILEHYCGLIAFTNVVNFDQTSCSFYKLQFL